jgi:hypothetical protein
LLLLALPDTTGLKPLDAILKAVNPSLEALNAGFESVNPCLYITNPSLEFRETGSEACHFGLQAAYFFATRWMSRAMVSRWSAVWARRSPLHLLVLVTADNRARQQAPR